MEPCLVCHKEFNRLASHVTRTHGIQFEDYLLAHVHGGVRPKCECGCGKEAPFSKSQGMRYLRYLHGHSARVPGRLTEESKAKISEKNRENMKRFFSENPDIAETRAKQMREGATAESEERRKRTLKVTNSTTERRSKMSLHTKSLWQRGDIMKRAREKAAETFKSRAAAGQYDFDSRNSKISETVTRLYVEGKTSFSKGSYTSHKTCRTHEYRSSWERDLMTLLDSDYRVVMWDYEFDVIKYEHEGKTHRYVPDFLVVSTTGKKALVEVKPMSLRGISRNVAKRLAALEYCSSKSLSYVEWEPPDGVEQIINACLDMNII